MHFIEYLFWVLINGVLIMQLKTPKSLKDDHQVLLSELNNIAQPKTELGENAKIVASAFQSHVYREEKTVLPHLSLLMTIAEGKWNIETKEALLENNILQKEFQDLKIEHKKILEAAQEMIKTAKREKNKEGKKIAEAIILHIQVEEEVSYPAIMMINKYLKMLK